MSETDRLAKLKNLLDKNPANSFVLYGIAMEYRSRGELERASEYFEELLNEFPRYRAAFLQQGLTLVDLGEAERARRAYEKGIRVCEEAGDTHAVCELREALERLSAAREGPMR